MARNMIFLAWIAAFMLLVGVFSGLLDSQAPPQRWAEIDPRTCDQAIVIPQDLRGHYVFQGLINQQPVVFLLDTGATNVSLPSHIAAPLGLPQGRKYPVSTANGNVMVTQTVIDELQIGPLKLHQIDASINPGMQANKILLGMSVLKDLELTQVNNELIIKCPQ